MTSPVRAPRLAPRRLSPAAPVPKRRDHLRVVPAASPVPRRRAAGPIVAATVVVVFSSFLAAAIFHGLLVSGQSHLDEVEQQVREEQADLASEKLVLADLQAPARIAAEAERRGMVPAEGQRWLSPGTEAPPVVTGSDADSPSVDEPVEEPVDERADTVGATDDLASAPVTGDAP